MTQNLDLEHIKDSLYPISHQISRIKRLSKILYNLICDPIGDTNEADIATVSCILNDYTCSLNTKMQKLELELKM